MKLIITIALSALLTACAAPVYQDPIAAQCDYESDVATANINNPIMAGMQKVQMFNKCVQIRRMASK